MTMYALKHFMIGLLLTGALGQPALALTDTDNRKQGLSAEELAFAFGDPNADGFKVLSPEEMAETKGAWNWITFRRIFGWVGGAGVGAAIRAMGYYSAWSVRYPGWHIKVMRHGGHHQFEDDMYYRHWQIVRWKDGGKGSGVTERFPFG